MPSTNVRLKRKAWSELKSKYGRLHVCIKKILVEICSNQQQISLIEFQVSIQNKFVDNIRKLYNNVDEKLFYIFVLKIE